MAIFRRDKKYKGQGYCVKCREKREFSGPIVITKNNFRMAKGQCSTCGTTINRILGKESV